MFVHAPSVPTLRCHWNVLAIVPVPVQVPSVAVSVTPGLAAPEIDGTTVLAGSFGEYVVSPSATAFQPDFVPA